MTYEDRSVLGRRHILLAGVAAGIGILPSPGRAGEAQMQFSPPLPGGVNKRELTTAFPQKGSMILQRTRPPLLETPFEVFDNGVFTPNNQFFVRWHLAEIPTDIDAGKFRLAIRGHIERPLSLSLQELMALPRVELAAVNQCSGNSRGYFMPRVAGGEWGNGAMGNARWTGVRLKDVLDQAGAKSGALQVRFNGLDGPVLPATPKFMKSLSLDHARDGEVMIAYAMNGAPLPLLNGFPLRLIVPGWYATYWVKMLNDIEVLDHPDENFWMTKAYTIPDTPRASITPGQTGVKMVPINRMVPRSFITNLAAGATLRAGAPTPVRGIAFGGDTGVARVEFSDDDGATWQAAKLGPDEGKYSFRQWHGSFQMAAGPRVLKVRCTSSAGETQTEAPIWNPAGFMRNTIESTPVVAS
jgi:DMSO/TMAO reductase YedYZ molybdopterin-dependent catalytic subunit